MNPFHIYLYGPSLTSLPIAGPFLTSFEEAVARLETMPGVSLEPDGSFGFASAGGHEKLFGMLYDAAGRLQYVDIRGEVTQATLLRVVQAICGAGESVERLVVLQLPSRELKTFQSFQATVWQTP